MSKPSASAVEGRAISARPSLRLFLGLLALAVPALAAPAAQAVPPKPLVLTSTNPPSSDSQPATSTTPRVSGQEEGVITSVIRFSAGPGGSPVTAAANPTNVVAIYTTPDCSGSPLATGNVGQLEEEGIEVEVAPDSTTTFYATQTDLTFPSEPSECSKPGLTYWHTTTPSTPPDDPPGGGLGGGEQPPTGGVPAPPPAPRLRTIPGGRANHNTPLVVGSAPGAATVKVFADLECKGAPVAKGPAEQLAKGFEIRVVDNTLAIFSAVSVGAGGESRCSEPVGYVEDSIAPRTRITMGPGAKTRKRNATFRFTDITDNAAPGTAFACKLDRRKWKSCVSPFRVKKLSRKRHMLRVKAVDLAGNVEGKGTKRRFKVIR